VRSATAPASSATVMTANMSWNEARANVGMWWPVAPVRVVAMLRRPEWANVPIRPLPPASGPKPSENPKDTQITEITARHATVSAIVLRTLLARSMPP
jgi:hypothetical protein